MRTTSNIKAKSGDIEDIAPSDAPATFNGVVTTAGIKVQLSDTPCKVVWLECNEGNGDLANGGTIVHGDTNVVAALATRRGTSLYPTMISEPIHVTNLNKIFIDSVDNGAKFHGRYET